MLLPVLEKEIGSGEKTAVYLEPVPLNSESEPPLTLISARVKSEEDSESSNSMRADSPTISLEELELIAMVGGVVSGGGAMEKERELLLSLPSLLKLPAASENELLAT